MENNTMAELGDTPLKLSSYICGEPVDSGREVEVFYPYDGTLAGTVSLISPADLDRAIKTALRGGKPLSRFARSEILEKARGLLLERADHFAHLIRRETGLCMRETRYEVGRAADVLQFAAMETLKDDGQIFSCDTTPAEKPRKIFTLREPSKLVAAITPFNHPLNQVAHKVAPAIAAGAPIMVKPSEKTPLTAIEFAKLLYEAGLPGWMLSVFVGEIDEIVEPMIRDERVKIVTFTGGTAVGKRIATIAGYKKLCLELGGNAPLIVLADAEIDLAITLAAEGSFRNSGQRCTSVKRLLVHEQILDEFTNRLVERTKEYTCGDPANGNTRVGTVIDEAAAKTLERRVNQAVEEGASVLIGGNRNGALMEPTVIANVPRTTEMVAEESFGPLAPIMAIKDLDDAIEYANSSNYGLSSGVVTNDLNAAMTAVRSLETGTVNVNDVPGYRIELSPFGGVKDSGLGIKEGVVEAIKFMTTVKTYSLPW
jgi:phosphonoacetaldehyde dehydrogenase